MIYVTPPLLINAKTTPKQACNLAGLNIDSPSTAPGEPGGPSVVVNWVFGLNPLTVEHELGHTFRLGHASVVPCPTCAVWESGSKFSVMGEGQGLSGLERWYLGWMHATEAVPDGSFQLTPFGITPSVFVVHTRGRHLRL